MVLGRRCGFRVIDIFDDYLAAYTKLRVLRTDITWIVVFKSVPSDLWCCLSATRSNFKLLFTILQILSIQFIDPSFFLFQIRWIEKFGKSGKAKTRPYKSRHYPVMGFFEKSFSILQTQSWLRFYSSFFSFQIRWIGKSGKSGRAKKRTNPGTTL